MPSSPVVLDPPGEDRASHERQLKCLKHECKMVHPNKQVHIYIYHMQASREEQSYYYGNKLGSYVDQAFFLPPLPLWSYNGNVECLFSHNYLILIIR